MQEDTVQFLRKLNDSINEDNHEKVLRYSEQVLIMKSDSDVTRCKLISLINLNKYEQAMQIQKSLDVENSEDAFIKAYLSYKLGKFKDCIDILENKGNVKTHTYKTKALLAQACNKTEKFEKSVNLYVDLLTNHKEQLTEDYEDVCTNF